MAGAGFIDRAYEKGGVVSGKKMKGKKAPKAKR